MIDKVEHLTDEQLNQAALDVLLRELGPDGLARYLRMNQSGKGNYTRDRNKWLKDRTLDDIMKDIRKSRKKAG